MAFLQGADSISTHCPVRARRTAHRAGTISAVARHPDFLKGTRASGDAPRPDVEADVRYRRADDSVSLAYQARLNFCRAIQGGEPSMRLAEAALWASAEDDAIASHSTVPFPVASYQGRISSITSHVRSQLATHGLLMSQQPEGAQPDPEVVLDVIERALFASPIPRSRFKRSAQIGQSAHQPYKVHSWNLKAPEHGRSALPHMVCVHHAGTWEVARDAYLHETLISRTGHAAALCIIYAQVMSELLSEGSVCFAVGMDICDYDDPPLAVPLFGLPTAHTPTTNKHTSDTHTCTTHTSDKVVVINTCTSDTLCELQRHLKRAFWCWEWDNRIDAYENGGNNSLGGFRAAAKAALGEDASAALTAISTVAQWRLERGIWTSPGAGDVRRARTAAERLVLLRGAADQQPEERRDLAVLCIHSGDLQTARTELSAYMDTSAFANTADPFDKGLCNRLMAALREALAQDTSSGRQPEPLTIESQLSAPEPEDTSRRPLTW